MAYQCITPEELDSVVQLWQKRLRMLDWTVRAKIVPKNKVSDGVRGEIDTEIKLQDASMTILGPESYGPDDEMDMEVVVVHELLHCKLAWADGLALKNPLAESAMEFTIESLAQALVDGYRK